MRKILENSLLQKFLHTDDNLMKGYQRLKNSDIVQLQLNGKQIEHIIKNPIKFGKICTLLLSNWNLQGGRYYKNITFNNVILQGSTFFHCLIFFNYKNSEARGYIQTGDFVELVIDKKRNEVQKELSIYEKVIKLIENKSLSVRNLKKLGMKQIESRKIYNYLKELKIFIVDKEDINKKIYFPQNIEKIEKEAINSIVC